MFEIPVEILISDDLLTSVLTDLRAAVSLVEGARSSMRIPPQADSAAAPFAAHANPEDPETGAQHSDPHGDPSHDRVSS